MHADGSPRMVVKFGVYDDDLPVFDWLRAGVEGPGQCLEAQVMDLADDVAYSVHDVEDGVVAGRIDLTAARPGGGVGRPSATGTSPTPTTPPSTQVLEGLRAVEAWPRTSYDGSRAQLAALKNLTSDLIGRFCGSVQEATFAAGDGPFVRYRAALVVPERTRLEIAVLKGIAAHYVMRADDRVALMERQRELMAELVTALLDRGPDALDRPFADDWAAAADDAARQRVVIDQVASLTDASAVSRHRALAAS